MSTALAPVQDATDKNIYESLALRGDMSALDPKDKAIYLQKLCESLGLNFLTLPFIPLKLNGKEILYASRGATDQLASINKLTREILKTERVEDVYVATCKVSAPDGRFDISTGAVTIGSLKGDALANALMKAETKAKRRATLSFCGLGFLDESEIETIPNNRIERVQTKTELVEIAKALPPAESSGSVIKDHHLNKEKETQWREAIVRMSEAVGKDSAPTLNFFDSHPADRERSYLKVRNCTISEIEKATHKDNSNWGYKDEGTVGFFQKHGISDLKTANDAQILSLVTELRELGNL